MTLGLIIELFLAVGWANSYLLPGPVQGQKKNSGDQAKMTLPNPVSLLTWLATLLAKSLCNAKETGKGTQYSCHELYDRLAWTQAQLIPMVQAWTVAKI